ncbi:MAG: preprotein translocase subunit SecG [Prevotellaceae bacterium]|jgi:preprotein translocase subunit SecG|nr:preprotein translocase subunit SecG [Prevotellaceae bacterium]
MYTFVSVLIIIAAVFLIIFVLVQNSKGGGLAANFASGNQAFGVRQTTDFLEKATWTLIASVFILCIIATASIPGLNVQTSRSAVQEKLQNVPDPDSRPEFPIMPSEGGAANEQIAPDTTN